MADSRWMLYGAYGYTGELLAEEAVRRGHRPTLAGRDESRLRPLAERLGLPMTAVSLDDASALQRAVEGHEAVLHAAGPFVRTGLPMLRACLSVKAHYLDITGEISMFEQAFAHDAEAKSRGVTVLSGAGFDVVPSDCLARYVCDQLQKPTELELAFAAVSRPSAGTTRSALDQFHLGTRVRRNGVLVRQRTGEGAKSIRFADRERMAAPVSWGDLSTAFRTTGVPNITTLMAMPASQVRAMKLAGPLLEQAVRWKPLHSLADALIRKRVHGPDETMRREGHSHLWARAVNAAGESAEAWLDTLEGYAFTALSGVRCLERVLAEKPLGAVTPAGAFGADFVLELEGSRRFDRVPHSGS